MMNRFLVFSLLPILMLNSMPLASNASAYVTLKSDGLVEGFAKFQSIDNSVFVSELKKLSPNDDVPEALAAQSNCFIERFRDATAGQFVKGVAKSRDINEKRREDALKKPPVKQPPSKTKKRDQGWTGTVKAVRTFAKLERGKADGRLLRSTINILSTYSAEVTLVGNRDLTGGIVNNFHGNARGTFVKEETRERNYAPGRMSCSGRMLDSPETQKNVLTYRGDSSGQTLVAAGINGDMGHIDFSPPPMMASFTHARISTKRRAHRMTG